jgi:hypothetical protein
MHTDRQTEGRSDFNSTVQSCEILEISNVSVSCHFENNLNLLKCICNLLRIRQLIEELCTYQLLNTACTMDYISKYSKIVVELVLKLYLPKR